MASGSSNPVGTNPAELDCNYSSSAGPGGGTDQQQTGAAQYNFHANVRANSMIANLCADRVGFNGPTFVNFVPTPFARYEARHPRPTVDDQALWDVPPPEDVTPHFREDDLAREIEEKFLSFVANSCTEDSDWRRLARKTKLDSASVSRLEDNCTGNTRELICQLLLTWKRRHPEYRVRDLIKLLSESKLQEAALELKKYFSSIHQAF